MTSRICRPVRRVLCGGRPAPRMSHWSVICLADADAVLLVLRFSVSLVPEDDGSLIALNFEPPGE